MRAMAFTVLAASMVGGCGYVANMQTGYVFGKYCKAPSDSDANAFLAKFALDQNRIIAIGNPTPLQLADTTFAEDQDRRAIATLAVSRAECFRQLESVNPDPQGRTLYNGTNIILARLFNREISFAQANRMAMSLMEEVMSLVQRREAARQEQWANVAAAGAAIYLNSVQSQIQTNRPTVLNCNTVRTSTTQSMQCVAYYSASQPE